MFKQKSFVKSAGAFRLSMMAFGILALAPASTSAREAERLQQNEEVDGGSGSTYNDSSPRNVQPNVVTNNGTPGVLKISCGTAPFLPCDVVTKELVDGSTTNRLGVKAMAQEISDGLYKEGKLYPNGRKNVDGSPREAEDFGNPPLCSPLKTVFNGCKEEIDKNHLGTDCGPVVQVYKIRSNPVKFGSALGTKGCGSRETSNIAASFTLILANSYNKLVDEVKANRLSVSSSSACYPAAEDVRKLIDEQKKMTNLEKIQSCDVTGQGDCSAKRYFEASVEAIRNSYLMVARCRLIEESTAQFRKFNADAINDIRTQVIAKMEGCFNGANIAGSADRAAMDRCYGEAYKKFIKEYLKGRFPAASQGCS